jgi:hypothetical protein
MELLRLIIDHKKVFVLALNGPGVGAGAAWFGGIADIVLASDSTYLQIPFSALGLVPENGSALNFHQSMGVHRANEFLMFGRKLSAEELENWGVVNKIFPTKGFHESVKEYLQGQLDVNDGKSMMETKRLTNQPLRDGRMLAVVNSVDALAERFVEDAPLARFAAKKAAMEGKSSLRCYKKGITLTDYQPNPRHNQNYRRTIYSSQTFEREPVCASAFTYIASFRFDSSRNADPGSSTSCGLDFIHAYFIQNRSCPNRCDTANSSHNVP